MSSEAVQRRLARWGLRVICVDCGRRGRAYPGERLREKVCPHCGGADGSVRALWWVVRYPERARALADDRARLRGSLGLT